MTTGPAPIGPADRRTFDEAQRRHRRATWVITALCAATVAAMGVAIGGLAIPLLFAMLGYGLAVGLGVFMLVALVPLLLASLVLPFLQPLADLAGQIVRAPTLLGPVVDWLRSSREGAASGGPSGQGAVEDVRPASRATTSVSASGATGLPRWTWYPAESARSRSSAHA